MPQSDEHKTPNWITTKVANVVWRITPHCREVTRLTSEGRDHPLPLGARLRLGLHRRFCVWCARYAGQLDLLQEASQRFPQHVAETGGPALADDARTRMKRELRNRGVSA